MKTITKVTLLLTLALALTLTFTACPKKDDPGEGDLQKWTEVSNSTFGSHNIEAIAYGKADGASVGRFVAGGITGEIAYSANGTSWTTAADSTFDTSYFCTISAIAYGKADGASVGRFVAVGHESSSYQNNTGRMAYSDDNGVTWTRISDSIFGTDTIRTIAYGNGIFVAGGQNGKMAYSANGTNWTSVADSKFGTSYIWGIAYGGGKFVAVGSNGKMAYSANGTSWTSVADSKFDTDNIWTIAYGNGIFVAGGDEGKMAYSADGVNWTAVADSTIWYYFNGSYTASVNIYAIAYGNGMFVAAGAAGKMAYSSDGASWTAVTESTSTFNIQAIAYGKADGASVGRFVAVGGEDSDGRIAYCDW